MLVQMLAKSVLCFRGVSRSFSAHAIVSFGLAPCLNGLKIIRRRLSENLRLLFRATPPIAAARSRCFEHPASDSQFRVDVPRPLTLVGHSYEMDPDRPLLTSKRELTDLCEVEDYETGLVLRSTFAFVDAQDTVWFGQACGVRKYDLTIKDLNRSLCRIADATVYPEMSPDLSIVADDAQLKSLYVKRPKFLCLDNLGETQLIPKMLAEEARVLEFFKSYGHRNLVRYHGCIARRGRIVGLALDKYDVILQYRFEDDPRELDVAACMKGIRAGIDCLHSQGFAHNDLHPSNIAMDKDDEPIILDFGSCRRFGEDLLSGGTPGWIDEDYSTSAQDHDERALEKIEAWLVETRARRIDEAPFETS